MGLHTPLRGSIVPAEMRIIRAAGLFFPSFLPRLLSAAGKKVHYTCRVLIGVPGALCLMRAKSRIIRAGRLLAFWVFSRGCYVPRVKRCIIRAEIGV